MEQYESEQQYLESVRERSLLPEGFRAATLPISFYPVERKLDGPLPMELSALVLDEPTVSFAGTFTKNRFPGAPVIVGKKRLEEKESQGVFINNKIANVCVQTGVEDVETLGRRCAGLLSIPSGRLFPASTGIIGWRLPVDAMCNALPELVSRLRKDESRRTLFEVSKGIMTTDRYPKVRSVTVGEGRITATAKGAGMIEPNMATLLVFVATDLAVSRGELRKLFPRIIDETVNRISVDGDQSTSDTALMFSSCKRKAFRQGDFEEGLFTVLRDLACDVVRNGEGTNHVIRVDVNGAGDTKLATEIGKAIVNSPLVKTAVFGNDPNVGRIVSSFGDFLGNHTGGPAVDSLDLSNVTITLGGETIFTAGAFSLDEKKESRLSAYLKERSLGTPPVTYPKHDKTVDISVILGDIPNGPVTVYGSDLSYQYVKENADYRS
jgi:glutamate N-acetyltransferase / amino-acid N-acetyltransferase